MSRLLIASTRRVILTFPRLLGHSEVKSSLALVRFLLPTNS
jgi:hypothetical protein